MRRRLFVYGAGYPYLLLALLVFVSGLWDWYTHKSIDWHRQDTVFVIPVVWVLLPLSIFLGLIGLFYISSDRWRLVRKLGLIQFWTQLPFFLFLIFPLPASNHRYPETSDWHDFHQYDVLNTTMQYVAIVAFISLLILLFNLTYAAIRGLYAAFKRD